MRHLVNVLATYAVLGAIAVVMAGSPSVYAENVSSKGEETFKRGEVNLRLKWSASKVTTGEYGYPTTKVSYSVFRNNVFMHPTTTTGGSVYGCHMTPPESVLWRKLGKPQIGWMLILSDICGNTNSYKVLVVVPQEDLFASYEFTSKQIPIVWSNEGVEISIWSSYQEWGNTGTSGSFFVPELREVDFIDGITCPPLPSDVRDWPKELPYRSFLGDYYAGLRSLNADVMRSALDAYNEIGFDRLELHGLPKSKKGLTELANKIEPMHELKKSLTGLGLPWVSTYQRQSGICR